MLPHAPVMRTVNNQGGGGLFGRDDFLDGNVKVTVIVEGVIDRDRYDCHTMQASRLTRARWSLRNRRATLAQG